VKAVVVYQSLWGSTAAVARAIAEGLGEGAVALSTTDATSKALAGADLIVAGAPIHALNLPTADSVKQAAAKPAGDNAIAADTSHTLMRDWLDALPAGSTRCAAFDTRVRGPLGHGGGSRIQRGMEKAGYVPLGKARGFCVALRPDQVTSAEGMLVPGELERARLWGREMAKALAAQAR
jgi:hypothetical protein